MPDQNRCHSAPATGDRRHRADLLARIRRLATPLAPIPAGARARLPRLPGLRAVLFDVYGTLLIASSGEVGTAGAVDNAAALQAALRAAGMAASSQRESERLLAAMEQAVADAHQRGRGQEGVRPEIDILKIWEQVLAPTTAPTALERLAVEYECRVNPTWPMPGARETIAALRETGLVLGIVSNAQFYTPLVLEAMLGASPPELGFSPRHCAWSWSLLQAKPSPAMFAGVLANLLTDHDISPAEVLYVGNDMLNDVWGARRAGCRTALFAGDARSLRRREDDARCADLEPDAVLVCLRQVMTVAGRGDRQTRQ